MFTDHQVETIDTIWAGKRVRTLNFDNIDVDKFHGSDVMPPNYAGLTWSSDWAVANVNEWYTLSPYPDSGWFSGVTSGEQIAYNQAGRPVEITAESFNIDGFNLTAAWDRKMSVEIVAYRDGEVVYDQSVIVGDKKPTHVELGLKGIDDLVLTPTEIKVDKDAGGGSGPYMIIDDMIVSGVKTLAAPVGGGHHVRDQLFASHVVDGHQPMHPDPGHIVALA